MNKYNIENNKKSQNHVKFLKWDYFKYSNIINHVNKN